MHSHYLQKSVFIKQRFGKSKTFVGALQPRPGCALAGTSTAGGIGTPLPAIRRALLSSVKSGLAVAVVHGRLLRPSPLPCNRKKWQKRRIGGATCSATIGRHVPYGSVNRDLFQFFFLFCGAASVRSTRFRKEKQKIAQL